MSEIIKAIEGIGTAFEEFKKTNDQRIDEERKGNEARARELASTLQRIESDLQDETKKKKELETRLKLQQERLEILEAVNDRPRTSIQEKARSELNDTFFTLLRSGFQDVEARQAYKHAQHRAIEAKAVTIGTPGDGGYALPEEIGRQIESLILKLSDVVGACKMVMAGTSDYKELVSVYGTTSAWVAETGTRSATGNANLRERAPTWGELYAYPSASEWALQDLFFDVANWLVQDASQGMALALSAAIYNGNGTAKPTGFTAAAPTSSADYSSPLRAGGVVQYVPCDSASPQVVGADDIIDLVYSLAPGYRSNGRFMMNTVTQGHVRKLKDTTNQYLWQPSLAAGQPDRLLGYPVGTWEDLSNPTTGDGFPVAFGDFARAYLLVSRTGMLIDRNPYATIGYTAFYIRKRYGGCVLNNDAVKLLKLADS